MVAAAIQGRETPRRSDNMATTRTKLGEKKSAAIPVFVRAHTAGQLNAAKRVLTQRGISMNDWFNDELAKLAKHDPKKGNRKEKPIQA
jgi:hypothetical protein